VGILGNERIDEAAKAVPSLQCINPLVFPTKTVLPLFI